MNDQLRLVGVLIACVVAAASCTRQPPHEESASHVNAASPQPPYFGQPTPGITPERFAPGVVSTDAIELNGVFTPDGREFFFTRLIDGVDTMHRSVFEDGKWSEPRPLLVFPGRVRAVAVDMSVSPDGQELYFLGQHPHEGARENPGYDLWVSRRVNGDWSTAQVVPAPVSTSAEELYPVVVADGSLYFSSNRAGGLGRSDVYRAQRLADGSFAEPVNVGPPINSEFGTGDTFVAPDESYLIVSSRRPGGLATVICSSPSGRTTANGETLSTLVKASIPTSTSSVQW